MWTRVIYLILDIHKEVLWILQEEARTVWGEEVGGHPTPGNK